MKKVFVSFLMVLGVVAMAGTAMAVPGVPGKAVSQISPLIAFDIEGDLTCGVGGFLQDDWAKKLTTPPSCPSGTSSIFSGTGPIESPTVPVAPNLTSVRFQDKAKSSLDNIYGQGSKQNDTNTWVEVTSAAPAKTDIGNVYSAARQGYLEPTSLPSGWSPQPITNLIAFMGFERISPNGNTHLDYELNQLPFVTNANGALVPQRCSFAGQMISGLTCKGPDLLIGIDDGTSKVPDMVVYKWVGLNDSPAVGEFVAIPEPPPGAPTFNLRATNSAPVPPGPWGTFNAKGALVLSNIATDTFSEVAVDLTVLTGLTVGCPGQFKSIFIKSRSSSVVNSELKDRIAPTPFGLDTCASMKITKRDASDPANITHLAGAVFTITPDPATGTGSITVTSDVNGVVFDSTQVKPGFYTIHEVFSPLGNLPVADQYCDVTTFKATCTLVIDNVGLQHLTAIKSASPISSSNVVSGQTIAYTITYSNDGTAPALNTIITDVVDTNLTNVVPVGGSFNASTRTIAWNVGNVGVGGGGTVSFTATVIAPLSNATILNKAHLINDRDLAGFDTNVTIHHVGLPNLTLNKAVDKSVASPGENLLYTLTYANIGEGDATAVVVTDLLPPKTTFVSATGGGVYSASTNTVSWNIGTVLHGVSGSVTFTVKLDPVFPNGTTTVTNYGEIISATTPLTPSNPVTTDVHAAPSLSISKALTAKTDRVIDLTNTAVLNSTEDPTGKMTSMSTLGVAKGSDLLYTINVANNGSADATNVAIVDTLPAGSTYISSSPVGVFNATSHAVTWSLGTLAAGGGTRSVTVSIRVGE